MDTHENIQAKEKQIQKLRTEIHSYKENLYKKEHLPTLKKSVGRFFKDTRTAHVNGKPRTWSEYIVIKKMMAHKFTAIHIAQDPYTAEFLVLEKTHHHGPHFHTTFFNWKTCRKRDFERAWKRATDRLSYMFLDPKTRRWKRVKP